jgi:uncharacterized protein YutE (UPF0331/DUF86 family)
VDNKKGEKVSEIEKYLKELKSVIQTDLDTYKNDFKIRAIYERYFEKIIEAVIDLAFIIIKEKNLKIPEDEESSFKILKNEGIISESLSERLSQAKGMRNLIAHEYGKIDDELVFKAVTQEIIVDVDEFLEAVA